MINYSAEWKKSIKLIQIPYDDFVSLNFLNGVFLEKVDGMLGVLIYKEGSKSYFQTTTGKKIYDIPVNDTYEKIFKNRDIREIKVAGELVARKGGKILPFNEIQSIVKRFKEPQNKNLIFHYPVDLISLNGSQMTFKQSLSFISKFLKGDHIIVPKFVFGGLKEFRKLFNDTRKTSGFDGVVVRDLNGRNYKVKFVESVDLVVIGAGHFGLPSWPRKQVSYLLTAFIDKSGYFRSSSKVGTGMTQKKRSELFNYINNHKVSEIGGEVFVEPKLMVEVKYFRYRITDTPSLSYSNNQYENIGKKKSITFSNPTFIRLRKDKVADKLNARLEQIPDFLY
jgi:ATP-dependent DNA ligase